MASRKRPSNPNQIGLVIPSAEPSPVPLPEIPPPANFDPESLDDYQEDATRLHLVDPPAPMPSIIVEATEIGFWVSRLRNDGTSSAAVLYSRKELEELIRRATAALEMSR